MPKRGGLLKDSTYYAAAINAEWRKSVQSILEVGQLLIQAKRLCEHGEFLRMFKGSNEAVSNPVPFGERSAEMLMAVASNSVISNPKFVSYLPQSWGTLYELTKLDDEQIVAGIKSGEITPDMTKAEASALRADPVEKPEQPPHEEMVAAVKNAVTKFVGQLTTRQQFEYVRQRLESLLKFLSEQESEHGSRRPRKTTAAKRAG